MFANNQVRRPLIERFQQGFCLFCRSHVVSLIFQIVGEGVPATLVSHGHRDFSCRMHYVKDRQATGSLRRSLTSPHRVLSATSVSLMAFSSPSSILATANSGSGRSCSRHSQPRLPTRLPTKVSAWSLHLGVKRRLFTKRKARGIRSSATRDRRRGNRRCSCGK